jgi:hypothetical protein
VAAALPILDVNLKSLAVQTQDHPVAGFLEIYRRSTVAGDVMRF